MKNNRAKFLSFMLTLVMFLMLLPGMSLTAYAETTYKVIIADGIEHGTVTKHREEAEEGATVPFVVHANDGYKVQTLTVTANDSTTISFQKSSDVTEETSNSCGFVFTMPAQAVTVNATFMSRPNYSVDITPGENMTKTTDSGAASQTETDVFGAMRDVVYTANEGYYFPEDYSVASVNGISVTRSSDTQIKVSGQPTANTAITLTAPSRLPSVSYVEMTYNATTLQVTSAEKFVTIASSIFVSPDITAWSNDAWYVVSGSVQVSGVTVTGSANLILCDGAELSVDAGITLANGSTLKIYAQSGGTGSLVATGSANTAGIGSGGTLTIHGGHISATGGSGAAAIAGSSVNVYSGHVVADGGSSASGITGTLTLSSTLRVFGGSSTTQINVLTDYSSNRPQYMRVATPHATHSLSNYQLSEDGFIITASCDNTDYLCALPNAFATMTILAPTAAGGAATLSGDVDAFGVSASNIMYAQRVDGTWGSDSFSVPSGSGFFRASITVGTLTASVTYGVNVITVKSGITNGTVTAPVVATVSVEVPLTISPATGYELDTLTVSTDSGSSLTVITGSYGSKSFIMPDEEVSVNATFKMTDYIISFDVKSASITVPATANYGETVRVVISPDAGYSVYSFDIDGVSDLTLVSKDTDTGVEIYSFTMPYQNISLDVTLSETTIYTIFYKAGDSVTSIAYRFSPTDISFDMRADAKADNTTCWGGQMRGAVGRASFPISFNVNNAGWGNFTDCAVVDNLSSFSSLADGTAVLIAGDENAFIASFKWGYYYTDDNGELKIRSDYGVKNFFVTGNTTSVTITNPTWTGYNFAGWSYIDKNGAEQRVTADNSGTITVAISGNIDKTTIFGAIWQIVSSTVSYDLNGGSWSKTGTDSVTYGSTLTQPTDPTRDGYAFDGWTVKSKTKAMKGSQAVTLAAGSNFDFATTKLTADITLQAAWKHVHAYAYIPLTKINDVIPNALSEANVAEYNTYMHFVMCSLVDDYYFEAHEFNKDGKCACGYTKPTSTAVTLEETYGNRNAGLIVISNPAKDSEVTLAAPSIGTNQFVKWEYRSLNGTTWKDLASSPVAGFIIPGSLRVNAVYEKLTAPQLTLQAEHYGDDGLLFTMQYMLPNGCKATNAAVVYGDNHMLRYMEIVRASTPLVTLELTDPFLGIPIPGTQIDIGTYDEGTYYYDREDNLLSETGDYVLLRDKMINGKAVNIQGNNEASSKKAQSLGQTSGYAYNGLTGVKDENSGNHYFYGLGYVEYTDANNSEHMAAVGPIAVTYNLTSSPVTSTDIHIYNY